MFICNACTSSLSLDLGCFFYVSIACSFFALDLNSSSSKSIIYRFYLLGYLIISACSIQEDIFKFIIALNVMA